MERGDRGEPHPAPSTGEVSSLEVLPLHSTDLLTLLDETGVVQYESPAIERLYGFEQDELVGRQVAECFHPDDREDVVAAFETIVQRDDGHVERVEYRHEQADGSYKWIESVASSDPTPDGHYVINSRDVSARKWREQQLERAREQVQSERDGKEAIRRLLLESSTDAEIAGNSCRLLVDVYGYDAAWVVRTPDDGPDGSPGLLPVASYGDDRAARSGADQSPLEEATRQVLETGDTVTVETADEDDLAEQLAARDLHAVRSVPLEHEGVTYGALAVVRSEPPTPVARELLTEFADAIAFKGQIHRQKAALVAETVVELGIRLTDGHVLAALSETLSLPSDTRIAAHELRDDGKLVTYLLETADVDAATLAEAAAETPGVSDIGRLRDDEDAAVVRIRAESTALGSVLSGYGGVLDAMTACDGRIDLTVQFPRLTSVEAVAGTIHDHWPDATIRSRTERAVERDDPATFDGLTLKQENALRAATVAGFFERPPLRVRLRPRR